MGRRLSIAVGAFLVLAGCGKDAPAPAAPPTTGGVVGRVTGPDGKPLAGVAVRAEGGPGGEAQRVLTDAEGRYAIRGLAAGEWEVFVLDAGWASPSLAESWRGGYDAVAVEIGAGRELVEDIAPTRAVTVRGRVLDADGKPVPGAQVTWRGSFVADTTTDADGRFIATIPPEAPDTAEVLSASYPPAEFEVARSDAGVTVDVDVRMPAAGWLRVRVVDADTQAAIPGAQAEAWMVSRSDIPGGWREVRERTLERTAGADGIAILGPLPVGAVTARAAAAGYQRPEGVATYASARGAAPDAPITVVALPREGLPEGPPPAPRALGTVRGRVAPPAGASPSEVALARGEPGEKPIGAWARGGHVVPVAADGSFEAKDLIVGEEYGFRATLGLDGRMWQATAVTATGRTDLVLTLSPAGPLPPAEPGKPAEAAKPPFARRFVSGRVLWPDGSGARGVYVYAWNGRGHARVGRDGQFRLECSTDPEERLVFEVPFAMAPVGRVAVSADDRDFVVRLHAAVAPRVQVVDPEGRPVALAEVRIEPAEDDERTFGDNREYVGPYSGPGWVERTCDAEGRTSFARLDPERTYVLVVEGDTVIRSGLLRLRDETWRPTAEATIRLARAYRILGVVRNAAGRPVGGARLFVRLVGSRRWEERGQSNADGTFRVPQIPAGRHEYVALAPDDDGVPPNDAVTVRVPAGAIDVVLVVRPRR